MNTTQWPEGLTYIKRYESRRIRNKTVLQNIIKSFILGEFHMCIQSILRPHLYISPTLPSNSFEWPPKSSTQLYLFFSVYNPVSLIRAAPICIAWNHPIQKRATCLEIDSPSSGSHQLSHTPQLYGEGLCVWAAPAGMWTDLILGGSYVSKQSFCDFMGIMCHVYQTIKN